MVFACGNVEVDEKTREIRRDGRVVHTEPKVFELLLHLIRCRDRVVPKQELFDTIWTGAAVGEAALTRCVYLARKALGAPELIRVVSRRGYRFIGPAMEKPLYAGATRVADPAAEPVSAGRDLQKTSSTSISTVTRRFWARSGTVPGFVGRERELALVEARQELASEGHGGGCLICGEAGIGKTRFLGELADRASARGMGTAHGESLDADGAPAYWPWLQVLRRLARATRAPHVTGTLRAASEELQQLVDALAVDETVSAVGSVRNRLLFFERVAEAIDRVAREQPLVISLDDLHQADLPSLHLVSFLIGALASSRVLLLGAYRAGDLATDAERSAALEPALKGQASVELEGLSIGEVESLLEQHVDPTRRPEAARFLHSKSAGNPFFSRN